ncbi:PKD domain-containing protein [Halomarina salina]|uniref:PKD domain-containing protein n=1 Tax=Halomarina salina TaxID=1872699 RepID=A0ABD5RRH6_9EURY|nr:PKD domain-containing protein [Halomarina salina]
MRTKPLALAAFVVVATVGPVAAVGGVDRISEPLADAGLDQSVERGTTVLLDGSGSRAPDGRIAEYEWRIETPTGTAVSPREPTEPRTTFVAETVGRYVVTLTVTDDSGDTASDSLYVDVGEAATTPTTTTTAPTSTPSTPVSTTPPPAGPPDTPTPVDRSPTIRGPQLVTGDRPLGGEYSIATSGTVDQVEWTVDGDVEATGQSLVRSWSPGDHRLTATVSFADGTTEKADFADGTNRIVADPRPDLSLSDLVSQDGLSGTASATDGYGNLKSVDVSVDGLGTRGREVNDGSRSTVDFDWADAKPGRDYDIVVTAVDERGQQTTLNRTVTVLAPPEVVSAEFVNGPVDSYHPRIDAERYTAHHVLKIDLNGHSVADLGIDVSAEKPTDVRRIAGRKVATEDGIATVHTYWAGESPSSGSPYGVKFVLEMKSHQPSKMISDGSSGFIVTPSKSVMRIEMLNDGTRPVGGSGGSTRAPIDTREDIIIDASDSFDPDGTTLTYIWKNGAEATERDDSIGRLSGWEDGKIIIEDDSGARVYQNWSAQKTLVPNIESTEVVGEGPFSPDEPVRVEVRTALVQLRRNTANLDIGAELRGVPGEVVEWDELYTDAVGGENDFAFEGTIELPASALAKNGPDARLVLYNEKRPDYARKTTTLPTVALTGSQRTGRGTLDVTNLRYVIRKQTEETTVANARSEMQQLVDAGYEVKNSESTTVGYRIEEHVRTQEEIVDTDSREFSSTYSRRLFLKTHSQWTADGVQTHRERVRETHTEWRRTKGNGFTGETRRVRTDPAEYSTEREYEYSTVEPRTREITSRQCPLYGRCYEVTYERTVYVDVTHTYWARSKHLSYHSATGDVRRTLVDAAEYATEYEHRYSTWRTKTEREYVASHTTIVQPAKYEWQQVDTVENERAAWRQVSGQTDYRIGDTLTERRWMMSRTNTEEVIRPAYTEEDRVVGTRATVSGTIIRYRTGGSGPGTARVIDDFSTHFSSRGLLSRADIKERVRESEGGQ